MGWHDERFTRDNRRVHQPCRACGQSMWLPPSKLRDHTHCSLICSRATNAAEREKRRRPCATCGTSFIPRQVQITNGGGRYCSQRCNTAAQTAGNAPAAKAKARATFAANFAAGIIVRPSGPANPQWRGGNVARRERMRESGLSAARLRRYRKANPDKVREQASRRAGRKVGRLPRGTVKRIGAAQRWRCAICAVSVKDGYHLDHIMPLARGGEHAARNVQLLCQTCNVRKSSKDPLVYMREIGRLL